MSKPEHIHSALIGFGAEGQTWADRMIFPAADDIDRGPDSRFPYPWAVEVEWAVSEGKAVPTGVQLLAMHGQPVTATAWRSVPVAKLIEQARRDTRHLHGTAASLLSAHNVPGSRAHEELTDLLEPVPTRRRGRPFLEDDAHYKRVAETYNNAVNTSDPHPRKAVADEFNCAPGDTRPKAWVREARRRNLIPKPSETQRDSSNHKPHDTAKQESGDE